jgi:hypothetical protein
MATQKIASGRTASGTTGWQQYGAPNNTGVFVDVNTSAAQFSTTPVYTISIGGEGHHWSLTGTASIYEASPKGFRVYLRWADGKPLTPAQANESGKRWYVNWIGVEG